jgi:hypothetical protein
MSKEFAPHRSAARLDGWLVRNAPTRHRPGNRRGVFVSSDSTTLNLKNPEEGL